MVVLNDLQRIPLINDNKFKEASNIAKANYVSKKNETNKKMQCDAELCLIYNCDVENDWAEMLTCKNTCKIHIHCEGVVLIDEEECMPTNYECKQCQSGKSNKEWLEETLKNKNKELNNLHNNLSKRITSVKAKIDHHEHIEESVSGPKQRLLKEAMKILGDIARYHGGDLQGKQVQKLFHYVREKKFELLKCIKHDPILHEKFVRALETLANVSDALKMPLETFDDEDVLMIKSLCEKWGRHWPVDFPNNNITPKGHILTFVIPKVISETRSFFRFYKVEQKGESIHADFNDIDRKVWCIRKKEERLWKLIERYELRNVTNVEIVIPAKRVLKKHKQRNYRYI